MGASHAITPTCGSTAQHPPSPREDPGSVGGGCREPGGEGKFLGRPGNAWRGRRAAGLGSLAGPSPWTVANTPEIWGKPHSPALTGPHVSAQEPTGRHGQASPGKVTHSLPFSSSLEPRKARTSPSPSRGPSCPTGPEGFTKTLPPPSSPSPAGKRDNRHLPPAPHLHQQRERGGSRQWLHAALL